MIPGWLKVETEAKVEAENLVSRTRAEAEDRGQNVKTGAI